MTAALKAVSSNISLTIGTATIPIKRPQRASASAQRDEALVVTALTRDGDGNEGFGYANFWRPQHLDAAAQAALALGAKAGADLIQLLDIERMEELLFEKESNSFSKGAASAISLAAWELAARRQKIPCAALWGAKTGPLPCYGTSFFLDVPPGALDEEIARFKAQGYKSVKLRIGSASWRDDAKRVQIVQAAFPGDGQVAADARELWKAEQVSQFLGELTTKLRWIEDAAEKSELSKIKSSVPLAGGEVCGSREELLALGQAGLDVLLIDLAHIGGPLRFLEAARMLSALGYRVGAHGFPYHTAHLLGAVPNHGPVEVLNWWDSLFVGRPVPDADGMFPQVGPGFGVSPNHEFLAANGRVLKVFT